MTHAPLRQGLGALLLSGLAACAANPKGSATAPIDYRSGPPKVASAAPAKSSKAAGKPATKSAALAAPRYTGPTSAPSPATSIPPSAERPSASPAVTEARLLAAETGPRPGGPLRQPSPPPSARAIDVQRGDTLAAIARRYSVNKQALIDANRLQPPYALPIGGQIYLPAPNIHVVETGETLYAVSRRFNIDTRSLAVMNGLQQPWTVYPGDELLLPPLATTDFGTGGAAVQAAPLQAAALSPAPVKAAPAAGKTGPDKPAPKSAAGLVAAGASPKGGFVWPVAGPVVAGFGLSGTGQQNDGVDLAVDPGAPVRAAAAGQVVYAGQGVNGVGNLLLIQHSGGWVTAYGQADRLLVKEGDTVMQGAPVAIARTGPNPRLHFELRLGKDPVDPAARLPQRD